MTSRLWLALMAVAAGFVAASLFPEWSQRLRSAIGVTTADTSRAREPWADIRERVREERPGVRLTEEEIKSAGV
jgi:hypothetical protein